MVTINFTLVVELVLFLIFLWGTNVFVLRPLLIAMDKRDEDIAEDIAQSEKDHDAAQEMEGQYKGKLAAMRRKADERMRLERRRALEAHGKTLAEERHKADEVVAALRADAQRQLEEQRDAIGAKAPEVADEIARCLDIRGVSA